MPVELAVPPPRPKRKSSKPYPRKVEGFNDIVNQAGQLSLQALPDYAALVKSGGEVTDVTVAAVTAAASAAAAAAAAEVVAAAGKEIETKLQVGGRAGWVGTAGRPALLYTALRWCVALHKKQARSCLAPTSPAPRPFCPSRAPCRPAHPACSPSTASPLPCCAR